MNCYNDVGTSGAVFKFIGDKNAQLQYDALF